MTKSWQLNDPPASPESVKKICDEIYARLGWKRRIEEERNSEEPLPEPPPEDLSYLKDLPF